MPATRRRKLRSDLARLHQRAFRHYEGCAKLLQQLDRMLTRGRRGPAHKLATRLYDWLLVPYSLWPIDLAGAAAYFIAECDAAHPINDDFTFLIELLGVPPAAETQERIEEFEHLVAKGNYGSLIRCPEKFTAQEALLAFDSHLVEAWTRLKASYAATQYAHKGVIRRRMSEERNFRRGWEFRWVAEKDRFQLLFDAMCYRWQLYGMEGDRPLLLKLAVNPMPHGTMIVIPRFWSLDGDRDLHWKAIGHVHRAHGMARQGPKALRNRAAMYREAVDVVRRLTEGRQQGLRGERLNTYIFEQLGKDPGTDVSWIKRRVRLARSLGFREDRSQKTLH